jgi:hypothetical protein
VERFVSGFGPDAIVCTHMFPLTVLGQKVKLAGV